MIYKKAQLDTLTAFAILFLGVVFAVVFVIVSSFVGTLRASDAGNINFEVTRFEADDFLFEEIKVKGEEMWMINAISEWKKNNENNNADYFSDLKEGLRVFVENSNENNCAGIFISDFQNLDGAWPLSSEGDVKVIWERLGTKTIDRSDYVPIIGTELRKSIKTVPFSHENGELFYISYFYGRCENSLSPF